MFSSPPIFSSLNPLNASITEIKRDSFADKRSSPIFAASSRAQPSSLSGCSLQSTLILLKPFTPTSCSFPNEKLEKGGLLNRFISKENLDNSYKKYICKDIAGHRLVYPISYSSKMKFTIMGETIILSEKEFRESRITIKDNKFNQISDENLTRIKTEREIYGRKISVKSVKKYQDTKFNFPAKGIISSEYGVKRFINGSPRNPHLGLDIAAETGTSVVAPENGKVIFVGEFFYRGNLIIIDHGNGIISTYSHLNETFVSEGDNVLKNSKIGTVGSSGRVTGPHLHFEIILLGTKVNPMLFL